MNQEYNFSTVADQAMNSYPQQGSNQPYYGNYQGYDMNQNGQMGGQQYYQDYQQPNYYTDPNQGYGGMDYGGYGYQQPRNNKQMKQMKYINAAYQSQLYQQQQALDQQNNQMLALLEEQDAMRRDLEYQRYVIDKNRQKHSSRDRERDALDLLDNYSKSIKHGRYNLNDIANVGFDNIDTRRAQSTRSLGSFNQGSKPNSAFVKNANMMLNKSISPQSGNNNYYNPNQNDPYFNPQMVAQTPMDMYYMMLMNEKMQREEKKNNYTSKTSEILMQSLEKQNQIISKLAGSIGRERDEKISSEAKEIEERIKQLEFETQAKQHQLFSQNIFDNLATNYNRKIPDNNFQKIDNFIPGVVPNLVTPQQLYQVQSLFSGTGGVLGGGTPPFVALPNQLMQQKERLAKLKDKKKKKEKEKKGKLKEMLLLLGIGEDPEDEEDDDLLAPNQQQLMQMQMMPMMGQMGQQKNPEEEKQKGVGDLYLEEGKRKKLKNRMMAILWYRMFPRLYQIDWKKRKLLDRFDAYGAMNDKLGNTMQEMFTWLANSCAKAVDTVHKIIIFYLEIVEKPKEAYHICAVGGKMPKDKEIDARCNELQKFMKALLDGLTNGTKEGNVPPDALEYLGDISMDYCFPPNNFLFNFEIQRLAFNHNAALKDTKPEKVQMIVVFFVLVRLLLGEMLFKLWDMPNVKPVDNVARTVKAIASIFMILIVDIFKGKVLVTRDNQSHLDGESKIRPRASPIEFNAPVDLKDYDGEEAPRKDEVANIIVNLYTKDDLTGYFIKKHSQEIMALIRGWAEQFADMVMRVRNAKVAERRKKNRSGW